MSGIRHEPWRLGATEIAAAIRSREVTATEVIDAHLDRIADVDDAVRAVVVVLREEARKAARAADDARASIISRATHRTITAERLAVERGRPRAGAPRLGPTARRR